MIQIKKVTNANYNEIVSLDVFSYQKAFIDDVKTIMNEKQKDTQLFNAGLYDDDKLIGYACYGYTATTKAAWLEDIIIDRKYQGQGYGRKFVSFFISYLKKKFRTNHVYLSCDVRNQVAKHLYSSLGFIETGLINSYKEHILVHY